MSQSLVGLLNARRPSAPVDIVAPEWSLPVIGRMPGVRRGIALSVAHGEFGLGKRRALGTQLRATGYGQAIVLPRSFKAALVPWFAGIPRRTGFRGEMRYGLINDMRPFDRDVLDQTVKRFVALGAEPGESRPAFPMPVLNVNEERQAAAMRRLGIEGSRPAVALMPGAEYGPAKCWPLEYYAELAGRLDAAGYDVWVLGSARDRAAGERIAASGHARNLAGDTSLEDAIDLLAACEQAVSNDSGLMHVAAAVGTRIIAIYGSSSPAFTPPLSERSQIHYLELDCSPCFERECPLGHLRCLREIKPADIMAGIETPVTGG